MTKIAVWSHCSSGPFITALTSLVTHACPFEMESGGCSLSPKLGTTHDTEGRVPLAAASKNLLCGLTRPNCLVASIVLNPGSGFMIGLVRSASASDSFGQGGVMHVSLPT